MLSDEPTGNLASENARILMDLFYKINHDRQTTIILVTHEGMLAQQAYRCIIMKDGTLSVEN